jgi:hypothetical protein
VIGRAARQQGRCTALEQLVGFSITVVLYAATILGGA